MQFEWLLLHQSPKHDALLHPGCHEQHPDASPDDVGSWSSPGLGSDTMVGGTEGGYQLLAEVCTPKVFCQSADRVALRLSLVLSTAKIIAEASSPPTTAARGRYRGGGASGIGNRAGVWETRGRVDPSRTSETSPARKVQTRRVSPHRGQPARVGGSTDERGPLEDEMGGTGGG